LTDEGFRVQETRYIRTIKAQNIKVNPFTMCYIR